jgi:hypothetical protein
MKCSIAGLLRSSISAKPFRAYRKLHSVVFRRNVTLLHSDRLVCGPVPTKNSVLTELVEFR